MGSSVLRTYTQHKYRGKKILVCWIQNRCKKCGRFLNKRKLKYCSVCGEDNIKHHYFQNKKYRQTAKGKESLKRWSSSNKAKIAAHIRYIKNSEGKVLKRLKSRWSNYL